MPLRQFLSLLFTLLILHGCARTPPEQALRETVTAMQRAVEKRDASGFMKHVSPSFKGQSGESGDIDRDGVRRLLAGVLLAHPNVKVALTIVSLKIEGDHADSVIEAVAASGVGALPDHARRFTFTLRWARSGSDWLLTRAQWES